MKLPLFSLTISLMAGLCRSISFLTLIAQGEGCADPFKTANTCGYSVLTVQGVDKSPHGRGHNIVVLDGTTGDFIESNHFDTHANSTAGDEMRDYLNAITGDKIVMVATQEDASQYWQSSADALKRLGATDSMYLEYRSSFALIGYAGTNKPYWIAQDQHNRTKGPSVIYLRIPLQQDAPGPEMSVYLRSEGCLDPNKTAACGRAFIEVNGQEYCGKRRGVNVVVFSAEGVFLETRGFDTWGYVGMGESAANYLNGLSGEKIVLVAFQDEASRFGAALPDALKSVGATEPIVLEYRSSFALAGYAGSFMPSWVSQAQAKPGEGPSILTTTITPEVDECEE